MLCYIRFLGVHLYRKLYHLLISLVDIHHVCIYVHIYSSDSYQNNQDMFLISHQQHPVLGDQPVFLTSAFIPNNRGISKS